MVRQSLAAFPESVDAILRFATVHTWGYRFLFLGAFLGAVEHFHCLPFLPPCPLCVCAFKGLFIILRPSLNAVPVGILIQLDGEHQSATGLHMFPTLPHRFCE